MSKNKSFATVINCMDGRTQLPVSTWLKNNFKVDYVDTITEPGPEKILDLGKNKAVIKDIKKRVGISINKHGSKIIAIVAHHDCAGNPVKKAEHLRDLCLAIRHVDKWGFNVEIIGLWVDSKWKVNQI